MRSLCKTFADRAAQLQFVQVNLDTKFAHGQSGSSPFNMELITEKPVLLRSSSYEAALELKEFLSEQELPADVKACLESGIMLGKEKFETLERRQLNDISYWLKREYPGCQLPDELPNATMTFQRILKPTEYDIGMVYRVSESVAIRDFDNEDTEWVMKITNVNRIA